PRSRQSQADPIASVSAVKSVATFCAAGTIAVAAAALGLDPSAFTWALSADRLDFSALICGWYCEPAALARSFTSGCTASGFVVPGVMPWGIGFTLSRSLTAALTASRLPHTAGLLLPPQPLATSATSTGVTSARRARRAGSAQRGRRAPVEWEGTVAAAE